MKKRVLSSSVTLPSSGYKQNGYYYHYEGLFHDKKTVDFYKKQAQKAGKKTAVRKGKWGYDSTKYALYVTTVNPQKR